MYDQSLNTQKIEMQSKTIANIINIMKLILQKLSSYESYLNTLLKTIANRSSIRYPHMVDVDAKTCTVLDKYTSQYVNIQFANHSLKISFHYNYQDATMNFLIWFLLQYKIHHKLNISTFNILSFWT